MRESVGNTYLLGFAVFVVTIVMLLFVASLNYTKAFKVKNKIVNILETYGGYTTEARDEIEQSLSEIKYRIDNNPNCEAKGRFSESEVVTQQGNTNYRYCIYKFNKDEEKGAYYGVVAYMYFEIPLIGKTLEFPVYGETKTLGLLG